MSACEEVQIVVESWREDQYGPRPYDKLIGKLLVAAQRNESGQCVLVARWASGMKASFHVTLQKIERAPKRALGAAQ